MNKDIYFNEISNLLEIDNKDSSLAKITIGSDIDSVDMLKIMSFFEEKFDISLEADEIEGKNIEDLYKLIG
tara:strand:- start:1172 stop:1384 length:213 start_codon:yes stop_codon:yes gene_type:complete